MLADLAHHIALAQIIEQGQPIAQHRCARRQAVGHGVQYLGHRADHHMGLARRAMIEQDDIIQRPDDDRLRPFSTINFFPDHASGTSMAPSCPKAKRVAKCLTHQGKACSATPTGSSRAPTVISARI